MPQAMAVDDRLGTHTLDTLVTLDTQQLEVPARPRTGGGSSASGKRRVVFTAAPSGGE